MKKILLGAAAALVMGISGAANADLVRLKWTPLLQSVVHASDYGGCMVRLPSTTAIAPEHGCKEGFVTFSCTGELQDPDIAQRLFDSAQISVVTGREIQFTVDTNKRHNGFCLAIRADVK